MNQQIRPYGEMLQDQRWETKRAEILERDQHECAFCKSKDTLQVHHRQYHFIKSEEQFVLPWDYHQVHLITLCKSCHDAGHQLYQIPTKYI